MDEEELKMYTRGSINKKLIITGSKNVSNVIGINI